MTIGISRLTREAFPSGSCFSMIFWATARLLTRFPRCDWPLGNTFPIMSFLRASSRPDSLPFAKWTPCAWRVSASFSASVAFPDTCSVGSGWWSGPTEARFREGGLGCAPFAEYGLSKVFALSQKKSQAAEQLAGRQFLRGADAVYSQLAYEHSVPLITLDLEIRDRTSGLLQVFSPRAWMESLE